MSFASVNPLKNQNATLTKQLDELQNGAARLLGEAQAYVADKSYSNAQQALSTLLEKHPSSDEAVAGKKLAAEVAAVVELRDQKWLAAVGAVKTAWEASAAAELRAEADSVRQKVDLTMADILDTKWEQSKDRVRQQWENGEI
jgi:predicted Zn-dependent protease